MIKTSSKLFAVAAFAGAIAATPLGARAAADDAYTANDVLLLFQNPGGTVGTDQVVYYSLGSTYNVFREAATPGSGSFGTTISLGNINTILTTTFGADWTGGSSTIFTGAAGQNGNTGSLNTSITNGDYARTVYVTKPRSGVGTVGEANSSSPLFDPAQTAVAGNIAGANNITGMTQPGAVHFNDTNIETYNPISNGNPGTAYGAISGGIQSALGTGSTFGNISAVMLLDLYRVTKTTGTNSSNSTLWHNSNNITATYSNNSYPGSNGARADYLGTIIVSANGDVNFTARSASAPVAQVPVITSAGSANGTVGTPFTYTITASNNATFFGATGLPAGLSVNTTTGLISGSPATAGTSQATITATNSGGVGNTTLSFTIARGTPLITTPPVASAITVGQSLSNSNLSGGNASVAGTFAFATPGFAPSATGSQIVVFTPSDAANYTTSNVSVVVTVNLPPVTPFNSWTGGNVSMTTQILSRYAIGGGSYDGATASQASVVSTTGGNLSLTAIVRENDPDLKVSAETISNLGGAWTSVGNGTVTGVDQSGVPTGHQRRLFSTPIGSDTKKFLRLRISYSAN